MDASGIYSNSLCITSLPSNLPENLEILKSSSVGCRYFLNALSATNLQASLTKYFMPLFLMLNFA